MADINEEQLLNELLRGVGRADRHVSSADLEARVLAAWDSGVGAAAKRGREPFRDVFNEKVPVPFSRYALYGGIAATIALAGGLPTLLKPNAPVAVPTFATEEVIATAPSPAFAPHRPRASAFASGASADKSAAKPVARVAPEAPLAPVAPVAPDSIVQSPIAQSPIEFVPLLPMTAHELTGSFQIVRVQMPRASLGPLASPTADPRELVEADVLLGEDGTARGIHISTNGSVYPWRPK